MGETRTTPFHLQSNAVIGRMNKNLQNMLANCVKEKKQSVISPALRYDGQLIFIT